MRTLRLLHTYQLLERLRKDSAIFKRNEEVIFASANLFVFIFVMTAIVYETQHYVNSNIHNYADALYFTITALTTTGFGDITLQGTAGRIDLGRHHGVRGDAVSQPGTYFVPAAQGLLPVSLMRSAAPRL